MVKNNFYLISLAVIILDQLLKFISEKYLVLNQSVVVIKNVFDLTLIHNTGAGFGILQSYTWAFIWLAVIILGIILFYWSDIKTNTERAIVALITGGVIGNLIDRIFFGYTIDFINFKIWPVFNIADAAMTIGVIALIYLMWKK